MMSLTGHVKSTRLVRVVAAAALAATLVLPFSHVSHAASPTTATTTVNFTVTGGDMSLDGVPATVTLPAVALNGGNAIPTGTASAGTANVSDARGTGAGWHVNSSATQLAAVNGSITNKLPAGYLTTDKALSVAKDDTSSGDVPAVTAAATQQLDAGAVKLVSAPVDTATGKGMGSYKVTLQNLKLPTLPASTYAGAYTTTITYSLVTAP